MCKDLAKFLPAHRSSILGTTGHVPPAQTKTLKSTLARLLPAALPAQGLLALILYVAFLPKRGKLSLLLEVLCYGMPLKPTVRFIWLPMSPSYKLFRSANNRYDAAIKSSLVAAGGTGFTFPPCSAPVFVPGTSYVGGSKVSFGGYVGILSPSILKLIFCQGISGRYDQDLFTTTVFLLDFRPNGIQQINPLLRAGIGTQVSCQQRIPISLANLSLFLVSACAGAGTAPTTSPNPTPTPGGSCAGITAWSSTAVYTGGTQAVYK